MSELVTGEAVVLGLRPARLPSRGLAVLVDLAVAWGAYLAVSLVLVSTMSSMDSAALAAASVAAFVLVQVGMPIAIETVSHGRSLGKVICGLRVVREDGGPIRFRHALVRGAMGAIEIVLTMGVVASIASLVSARGRRVGDVFAGTLVVRERIPVEEAGARLPAPAPWLAAQVEGLDLSRVPDRWWLTVRQYLGRMGQLDPQVGWAMAGRLAEDLRGFTGAMAPAEADPAAYLAAVVGERQAREARRAFGGSVGIPEEGTAWGPGPGPGFGPAPVPADGAGTVSLEGPVEGAAPVPVAGEGRWAAPGDVPAGRSPGVAGVPSAGASSSVAGGGAGRTDVMLEADGAGGVARTGFAPPA
ncbi:RDD family protein [Streptomyces sp. NPDC048483]|uniref:RDD family protein n=1 Tax=Streptomyces sp. NPDC048483 TaxID=3154927 RepID=UPI003425BE6B